MSTVSCVQGQTTGYCGDHQTADEVDAFVVEDADPRLEDHHHPAGEYDAEEGEDSAVDRHDIPHLDVERPPHAVLDIREDVHRDENRDTLQRPDSQCLHRIPHGKQIDQPEEDLYDRDERREPCEDFQSVDSHFVSLLVC